MAREDYNVADREIESLTAGEKVQETVFDNPDTEAREYAAANGVSQAAYAGYADALAAHTARDDIESLADRRAREYGDTFAAGDFMRAEAYNADGTAADAPRPGTVYGDAPDSGAVDAGGTDAIGDTDQDGTYEGAGEGPAPTP